MNKKILISFLIFVLSMQFVFADYSIQLGSFKSEARAKTAKLNFSKKLDKKQLFITKTALLKKGVWYRVKYGRFKDKSNANKILKDLKEKKIPAFLTIFPKSKVMNYFFKETNTGVNIVKTKVVANTITKKNTYPVSENQINNDINNDTLNIPMKINDIVMKNKQYLFKLGIINNLLLKEMRQEKKEDMKILIAKYKQLLVNYYDVPDLFKTYYMLSRCYLYENKLNKALPAIDKAISFASNKDKPAMIYEKGFLQYIFLRNYDKALDTFKELSLKYPDSSWALLAQRSINEILKFKVYKIN